jgi:hypothetical protein
LNGHRQDRSSRRQIIHKNRKEYKANTMNWALIFNSARVTGRVQSLPLWAVLSPWPFIGVFLFLPWPVPETFLRQQPRFWGGGPSSASCWECPKEPHLIYTSTAASSLEALPHRSRRPAAGMPSPIRSSSQYDGVVPRYFIRNRSDGTTRPQRKKIWPRGYVQLIVHHRMLH